MIRTRKQLLECIKADYNSYKMKHPLIARFTYGENWDLFSYMKNLRYLEWHVNNLNNTNIFSKWFHNIGLAFRWFIHRNKKKQLNIDISPNNVGPGFHLQHRGFRHILEGSKIGANCEILPMVLMGKKLPGIENAQITIGDNCYISTGVTILGPITIGDNVTIAAGAVVVKDVPDNCIVGGVPAQIIKYK